MDQSPFPGKTETSQVRTGGAGVAGVGGWRRLRIRDMAVRGEAPGSGSTRLSQSPCSALPRFLTSDDRTAWNILSLSPGKQEPCSYENGDAALSAQRRRRPLLTDLSAESPTRDTGSMNT